MDRKISNFIRSQAKQVRKGGFPVLFRKLYALPLMLLSVPIILFVRLIRPLIVVRFGTLQSERIGHFAPNTEIYLCERDSDRRRRRNLDIFYYNAPISNYQLKKMWDRVLCVCNFAKWTDKVNRLLPGGKYHIVPISACRDVYGLLRRMPPHLFFTTDEERLGQEGLRGLKIPEGNPFVCFHARDSAYLETALGNRNWHYHNFRNSNIHNYILAAKELVNRGYFAIRMGSVTKTRLDTADPRIIDYAVNSRKDFLDIYLGAKCHFFLCDTVGTYAIAEIFRRPIVWVNYIPLEYVPTWNENYLFIPKKLWVSGEKRFLTFREILNSGIGRYQSSEQYEQRGIEVIENTSEEIAAVVMEMDERLKGQWQESEEDAALQRRFWSLFRPNKWNQIFLSHIGAEFLRENQDLLGLSRGRL